VAKAELLSNGGRDYRLIPPVFQELKKRFGRTMPVAEKSAAGKSLARAEVSRPTRRGRLQHFTLHRMRVGREKKKKNKKPCFRAGPASQGKTSDQLSAPPPVLVRFPRPAPAAATSFFIVIS